MNYEVDKKSFYKMLEKLFNSIYGDDYVVLSGDSYHTCEIIDNIFCHTLNESYYLEDKYNRKILEHEFIVKAKRFDNYKKFNSDVFYNHSFKVNESKNEILELMVPYILEYPFLDMIPAVVECIVMNRYDGKKFVFNDNEVEAIEDVFKEYAAIDEKNRTDTEFKIINRIRKENL